MLVLSRRLEEGLVITSSGGEGDVVIRVLAVEGDKVKLGISAPRHVTVLRQELCDAVRDQNLAAARLAPQPEARAVETLRQWLAHEQSNPPAPRR